ncbi:MAG: FtsX-like permease family protein [Subdoligranulum sp.]
MLLFYIKHYIDTHKKELGILKALGYSNIKIAKSFWVFGISIFIGTVTGYAGSISYNAVVCTLYKMKIKCFLR